MTMEKDGMNTRKTRLLAKCALLLSATANAQGQGGLELECLLEPYSVVDIGTPVPGVLASVDVRRGDVVTKGQAVAHIDSRLEQAAVELAKARSEFSKRRIERSQALFTDDLLSEQEKDELETEGLLADLEVRQTMAQVEIRTIRSPINGVVVERVVEPGEFVLDTEILTLAQVNPINVEVIAPVQYFGQIEVGMSATVMPEAPLNGSYSAKVTVVDKVIDAASGTFGVRLEIPNNDLVVPAGLRCNVRF
jgi:RND family efflux transporter MFP subunit